MKKLYNKNIVKVVSIMKIEPFKVRVRNTL